MPRPKGSLNKKRPEPKPEKKIVEKHQTIKDLRNIAREQKVKLKVNYNYDEIREALGLEPIERPLRYDHCKEKKVAQAVVKTNVVTGEKTRYSSIFEMANSFGLFAGSITYRIRTGKSVVVDSITYTLSKE